MLKILLQCLRKYLFLRFNRVLKKYFFYFNFFFILSYYFNILIRKIIILKYKIFLKTIFTEMMQSAHLCQSNSFSNFTFLYW